MRVVVLGATGTVGQALLPLLADQHEVVAAVSRRPRAAQDGIRWATADVASGEGVAEASLSPVSRRLRRCGDASGSSAPSPPR